MLRIGHGFDAHCYVLDRPLILGGVTIPYEKGLLAHSDGDVLIHALIDALLGAAGLGDIGVHFPDTDKQYKNVDSRLLLTQTAQLISKSAFRLVNADITLIAQEPKLKPYIEAMCNNLSVDLQVARQQLNIKATTTEGMGFTGRKEGIAAHAVVLITAI